MLALLTQMLRSRWFAVCVHAAFWLLLYLAAVQLDGKEPNFSTTNPYAASPQTPVPVAKLEPLFTARDWMTPSAETNAENPFLTRYFVPPPKPAPPPPPTTKKIPVTYQGYFITATGPKKVIVKLPEGFARVAVGEPILTNYYAAQATMWSLLLTNKAAETNLLLLNTPKELEVPLK